MGDDPGAWRESMDDLMRVPEIDRDDILRQRRAANNRLADAICDLKLARDTWDGHLTTEEQERLIELQIQIEDLADDIEEREVVTDE